MAEITRDELELVLEALDDASFYRDARSHVLKSAVKRAGRRSADVPEADSGDIHRSKATAYRVLAVRLRSTR
jgi:hypothetical protein